MELSNRKDGRGAIPLGFIFRGALTRTHRCAMNGRQDAAAQGNRRSFDCALRAPLRMTNSWGHKSRSFPFAFAQGQDDNLLGGFCIVLRN